MAPSGSAPTRLFAMQRLAFAGHFFAYRNMPDFPLTSAAYAAYTTARKQSGAEGDPMPAFLADHGMMAKDAELKAGHLLAKYWQQIEAKLLTAKTAEMLDSGLNASEVSALLLSDKITDRAPIDAAKALNQAKP